MTTVFGDWSVTDLVSLIQAKDYDQAQLTAAYAAFAPTWVAQDPTGFAAWTNDWDALKQRYAAARDTAETFISVMKVNPVPNVDLSAESEYIGILQALKKQSDKYGEGPITPGDWDDLMTRYGAAGGTVDLSNEPQPTPGTDQDLNLFNWLGKLKPQPKTWPWWVIPSVAAAVGLTIVAKVKDIID